MRRLQPSLLLLLAVAGCGNPAPVAAPDMSCAGMLCGGACTDIQTDAKNCGECGKACEQGFSCAAGKCELRCPMPQVACGMECSTLASDPRHCGDCATVCKANEVCSMGKCGVTCGMPLTACGGACVNLMSDAKNCGMCGMDCGPGKACMAGACMVSCGLGLTNCGGSCVNTQSHLKHCGACDMACKDGELCVAGKCAANCPNNFKICGGVCTDTGSDSANCGDCGMACKPVEVCKAGACVANCAQGLILCNGECVNTATDRDHCGACGMGCGQGKVCQAGMCTGVCAQGFTDCGGSCANLMIDAANCGMCGVTCKMGETCAAGKCFLPCQAPSKVCANMCIDVRFDVANCGDCGKVCPQPANTSRACFQGACSTSCTGGYIDCDNNAGNGCEVKADDNLNNCGSCGRVCPTVPNATRSCSMSQCVQTCGAGFLDCDKVNVNGCEVNSTSDTKNCGACGTDCAGPNSTGSCVASKCTTKCNTGWDDCDKDLKNGCEADVSADVKNCGACGKVCPMNMPRCISGTCRNYPPPFAMWGGLNWYKIQVAGAMTDTNVKAACEALGLTVPCQVRGNCTYNGGNCNMKTPEMSCGNPMLGLAQGICNGASPPSCPALNGVYQYMGGNWNGNSACGALNGSWCSAGNGVQNQFALCIEP